VLLALVSARGFGFWQQYRLHAEVRATAGSAGIWSRGTCTARLMQRGLRVSHMAGNDGGFQAGPTFMPRPRLTSPNVTSILAAGSVRRMLGRSRTLRSNTRSTQAEGTLAQLRAKSAAVAGEPRSGAGDVGPRCIEIGSAGLGPPRNRADTDRPPCRRDDAVAVAPPNNHRAGGSAAVLNQQKPISAYRAFDGVITQREYRSRQSWCQADAAAGIPVPVDAQRRDPHPSFMCSRTKPSSRARHPGVARVTELPGREFPGMVSRIADALPSLARENF